MSPPRARPVPLVMLPGLDGTGALFEPLVRALPSFVRPHVIAYPTDRALTLEESAAFVRERLPDGRLALLAESFSGLVALTLLPQVAERVDAVVFCAAFAEPPRPLLLRLAPLVPGVGSIVRGSPAALLRLACLDASAPRALVDALQRAVRAVDPAVLRVRIGLIAEARAPGGRPCETPCLYLQAGEDALVPPGAADWFERRFATCARSVVAGPHLLLQARPGECAERIGAFLAARG